MFYVVEGELTLRLFTAAGGPPEVVLAGPGTAVRIDPRRPHNYVNESGAPVRIVVLVERSLVAFFRDIRTAEPQAMPDLARIGAAMERHGIDPLAISA